MKGAGDGDAVFREIVVAGSMYGWKALCQVLPGANGISGIRGCGQCCSDAQYDTGVQLLDQLVRRVQQTGTMSRTMSSSGHGQPDVSRIGGEGID